MSQLSKSAQYAYRSKNLLRLNICTHSVQFLKKIPKIDHWGSRSSKYMELGHFTLLFCRGRQRNVQRFKTHVHSYCSAHQTFCSATFPLPSPSWFAKTLYWKPGSYTNYAKWPNLLVPPLCSLYHSPNLKVFFRSPDTARTSSPT